MESKIIGILLIIMGVLLLLWVFFAYAKRRLTENFGLLWAVLALAALVSGIVVILVSKPVKVLTVLGAAAFVILVLCLFGLSQVVSVLTMKNQELAMQVSLLNQENESILREMLSLREQKKHE